MKTIIVSAVCAPRFRDSIGIASYRQSNKVAKETQLNYASIDPTTRQ